MNRVTPKQLKAKTVRTVAIVAARTVAPLLLGGAHCGLTDAPAYAGPQSATASQARPAAARVAARKISGVADHALPNSAVAQEKAADRLLRNGDLDEAARAYALAALAAPRAPILRLTTGVALSSVRRTKEAARQFRAAVDLADGDPIAALLLQGALMELGETDEAQSVYLETVRRFAARKGDSVGGAPSELDASASIARLESALAQIPDSPVLHLLLGDAYQVSEQWGKADTAYRRSIALAPMWAKPQVNYGLSRLAQGKPDEAISIFQRALARDPGNAQAYLWKGEAEVSSGRNQEAIKTLRRVASGPNVAKSVAAQALTGMGRANVNSGNVGAAVENFGQARKLAPSDPVPPAALGDAQARTGDYNAAAESYNTALRLTKAGGLFSTRPILYRALAESQLSARNPDAALATLARAASDEPTSSPVWFRLSAKAFFDKRDVVSGRVALRDALDAETERYPQETLALASQQKILLDLKAAYASELANADTGMRREGEIGGGVSVRSIAASPAERRATALRGLANIARYEGDTARETLWREQITVVRTQALDWFLLAEVYDQRRTGKPEQARRAYQRALEIGGLPDAATARAQMRLKALATPPLAAPAPPPRSAKPQKP